MGSEETLTDNNKFNTFLFLMIILVVVVVGTTQYQQFNLASISVEQNNKILNQSKHMENENLQLHKSVNLTTNNLQAVQQQIDKSNKALITNVSKAHDYLIATVTKIDESSNKRIHVMADLLENATNHIITKLNTHNQTTTNAFNNTEKNNELLIQILNILENKTK